MLSAEWIGDKEVRQRLGKLSPAIQEKAFEAIQRLSYKLQRDVQSNKLSGQVLKLRTGTLRRSIDVLVTREGAVSSGRVGTNLRYGIAHEFGFRGAVEVRGHLRTITQAFGKSIAPRVVEVRPYTMQMNLPERSFVRSALKDLIGRGEFDAEMNRALEDATKDTL